MLVYLKDPVPVEEHKGVVYSIPCVESTSVYIGQTGRSLKNGDIQTSALAEHVFKTGHAVDLSQSEVLGHHHHTITRCMLESWYIQHNQTVLNSEWQSWTDGHIFTYHLVFFFLLYIGFVSIVSNLTQHWCAWDHAACTCMGTPRWSTPGLIGMSLYALVWSRVICLIFWL